MRDIGFLYGISFHNELVGVFSKRNLPLGKISKQLIMINWEYGNDELLNLITIVETWVKYFGYFDRRKVSCPITTNY